MNTIISDFSNTVLFPKDKAYIGSLNALYREKKGTNDFNFWDHYELNNDLIVQYRQFKDEGVKIYLFTTGNVQDDPAMSETLSLFEKIFTIESIGGLEKIDPESYKYICNELNIDPETTLFVDDALENINAANSAGLKTIHYTKGKKIL